MSSFSFLDYDKFTIEEALNEYLQEKYNKRLDEVKKYYFDNFKKLNQKEKSYYLRKLNSLIQQTPYNKSLEDKINEATRDVKFKPKLYSANANLLQFMNDSKEIKHKSKGPKNYYSNAHLLHFVNDEKHYNKKIKNKTPKDYYSNSRLIKFMDGSKEIKDKEDKLELDNNLYNILNVSNLTLKDFHHKTIDPDNLPEAYQLLNLLKNTDPSTTNIIFRFNAELPDGTIVGEWRYFTIDSFNLISRIIENDCLMFEEDLGYDLGMITTEAKLISIEIIDLDQDSNSRRRRRRTMGFFNWLIKSNPFDLSRYQIYQKFEDIDPELCFIHSLREKGVNEDIISNISNDLNEIERITLETVEFIANKYNLFIEVNAVYPDKSYKTRYPRISMKDLNQNWIQICFFSIQNQDYPQHIIPYDTNIKFNINYLKCNEDQKKILDKYSVEELMKFSRFGLQGERFENKGNLIDSVKLLRDLHKFNSQALIPLTNDQKYELRNRNMNKNKEINFNISTTDYREWSKFGELNRIDQIFKNIPNLYQVSGNVEKIIRKCVSGLAPRISKKNNLIEEDVVCLDIISNHANAASKINIPLGIPKRWNKNINLSTVNSAYLLINIQSIGKHHKFDAVKDLQTGNRFVDLLTLHQLIKYHSIKYEILDGIYFDSGSVNISKEIHEIFEIRKQAKKDNNLELSNQIKNELNKNLYGKLLKKSKSIGTIYFDNQEEAQEYMFNHENAFRIFTKNGKSRVQYRKRFTNNYNLAHIGCLILSKVREIINNYIYKLEENEVEVLYSNVDSIFIRKSDLEKFNQLFPNSIGNELGNFHFEYSDIIKALFYDKGSYVLKLANNDYIVRDMFGKFKKNKIDINI